MTTKRVYRVGWSIEDDRPEIDFELTANRFDCDTGVRLLEILDYRRSRKEYQPLNFVVAAADAGEWHNYGFVSPLGMFSKTAVELLKPYMRKCFGFLEASINNKPYFLLRRKGTLDCLNRRLSKLIPFPDDPSGDIMEIKKYVFKKSIIPNPMLFMIPENSVAVFGTDEIKKIIEDSKLKGFRIVDSDELKW